jgi:hypothetical protein
MLPAEWGDVGNELVGNLPPLLPQMPHCAVEIYRVPMDDRGRSEALARGTIALILKGTIADLALAMEEDRAA